MEKYKLNGLNITLNRQGAEKYSKVSYPIRFGIYSVIETPDYIYQFCPDGRIKYVQAKNNDWPRDEWLKRTVGNDWIYYTPGIYTGLYDFIGEYYLPCFSYESNSIFSYRPFKNKNVETSINSLKNFIDDISDIIDSNLPHELKDFLISVIKKNTDAQNVNPFRLHEIIDTQVPVLPPDSRHVDYDVIPVIIADGCLYNCNFCTVKDGKDFKQRSRKNILRQIHDLKSFYGENLVNNNSLFLGLNDALNAGNDLIDFTLRHALEIFRPTDSYMNGANLFIFGSVYSFLNAEDSLFSLLNRSQYYSYINIGLESADQETLDYIGKPISVEDVHKAFNKMQKINRFYDRIEVTANFVFSNELPKNHNLSIVSLNNKFYSRRYEKGAVYLSPLSIDHPDIELNKKFIKLKNEMNTPVYIYLFQRL